MQRIVNEVTKLPNGETVVKRRSEVTFPDFTITTITISSQLKCEEEGKHLCVMKSRRKGYSYKGGAMAVRNYYLIPNSKTYVYASNKQYLTDDGIPY